MTDQEISDWNKWEDILYSINPQHASNARFLLERISALESRLALYEGWTPEDAETKEALENCDGRTMSGFSYQGERDAQVLARALRAAMGNLSDLHTVNKALGKDLWDRTTERDEGLIAIDRAEAANKELVESERLHALVCSDHYKNVDPWVRASALESERDKVAELEAKLEEARSALDKVKAACDLDSIPMLKLAAVFCLKTLERLGHPSPVSALRAKVLEAARVVAAALKNAEKANFPNGIYDADRAMCSAVDALDSAEAKERG